MFARMARYAPMTVPGASAARRYRRLAQRAPARPRRSRSSRRPNFWRGSASPIRTGPNTSSRRCRARRARPPRSSSPNGICRARKRCRTTWWSMPTDTPGTPTSAARWSASSIRRPARCGTIAIPTYRPEQPKGSLDLELDPDGNLWVGMAYQAGAAKIDRKTKAVTPYPLNKEWLNITSQTNQVTPTSMNVDGKVWMKESGHPQQLPSGYQDRPMGKHGPAEGSPAAGSSAATEFQRTRTTTSTCSSSATRGSGGLDAKTNITKIWATPTCEVAAAARPLRRAEPVVVRANSAATPSACSTPRPS